MKYGGPDVRLRMIVIAALMSSGVFASAWAAEVDVSPSNPGNVRVLEDAVTIDIEFTVTNTGMPEAPVKIGNITDHSITEFATPIGNDTQFDVLAPQFHILRTNCGIGIILGAGKSCSVVARYTVKDADPLDEHDTSNVGGLWFAGISVPWTTGGLIRRESAGGEDVLVEDAAGVGSFAIPEPSTWVGLLVGFSVLGFARYYKARARQL
jgi:hypothetical protein